jgi:hypothetical protein
VTLLLLPMDRERAYLITRYIPINASIQKKKTGGMWWAHFFRDGVRRLAYIGSASRLEEVRAAHKLVRVELEAERKTLDKRTIEALDRAAALYGQPITTRERGKKRKPKLLRTDRPPWEPWSPKRTTPERVAARPGSSPSSAPAERLAAR